MSPWQLVSRRGFGAGRHLYLLYSCICLSYISVYSLTLSCVHACMHFLSLKYVMEYNLVLSQSRRWKLCGLTMNRGSKYCKVQSCISIWYVPYGCTWVLDFAIGAAFKLKYKLPLLWKATVVWLARCSRTKKQLLF